MVPLAFARGLLTPPGKSDDPGVSRSTPPVLHGYQTTPLHGAHGLFFVPVLVGVVGWMGLYLRDRKLRALVPIVDE